MGNKPFSISKNPVLQDTILSLHAEGLNTIEIGSRLGFSNAAIGRFIRSKGLLSNGRRGPEMISGGLAKCRACKKVKSLVGWPVGRNPGKEKHYRSVCSDCFNASIYNKRNETIESRIKYKLGSVKARCKREKIPYELTFDNVFTIWNNQNGLCFYTDVPMILEAGIGRKQNSMSIDRVVTEVGYSDNNIVLAADRINTIKQNATIKEMKEWMPNWYSRIISDHRFSHLALQ